ncbi:hypothetical protein MHK_010670 [Candidatus Magnetomorum sp. HK-1]|nr:hypothetical protein MHK_010670 [Candidatus Magnetomorum sp. HK-1]
MKKIINAVKKNLIQTGIKRTKTRSLTLPGNLIEMSINASIQTGNVDWILLTLDKIMYEHLNK